MAIFGLFSKEVMYFPGCFSSALLKDHTENYRKILKKLDISFMMSKEAVCCGGILEEAGYEKQLRKLAKENSQSLEEKKIKKIITNCPSCYKTFKSYRELIPNFELEIEFIVSTVLNAIRENEKLIKTSFYQQVVYYDSCVLARYLKYMDEPRELLKAFGYEVLEIPNYNKEDTLCCGSCGNLPQINSQLAEEIAIAFIKKIAKLKVRKVVTADPAAYVHLKNILEKFKINEIEIVEISEIICDSLGIKKQEIGSNNIQEQMEEIIGEEKK